MNGHDVQSIAEVTDALYRTEVARMQKLLEEESRLREALARLDAQYAANRSLPETKLNGLRQIGGDMIWQAWTSRKKEELQSELARVLGRKGQRIAKLRRAFGKAQAVDQMMSVTRAQHISDIQARDEEMHRQLMLLDRWR